jgi:hypothetical protein
VIGKNPVSQTIPFFVGWVLLNPTYESLCLGVFVVHFISPTYHAIATNFFVNMV